MRNIFKPTEFGPPITYYTSRGFSINEGVFPNIHMSWNNERYRFYFYFAFRWFGRSIRWWFFLGER